MPRNNKDFFNDLPAVRERAIEERTYALANRPVNSYKRGKDMEIGFPMSGDAIARMRMMEKNQERWKR